MKRPLDVHKYGGSSVGTPDRLLRVARRVAVAARDRELVVVVSAMGDTTDELLTLAASVTAGAAPDRRELDALLATGENQSAALLAMALCAMDTPAVSLSGSQAGVAATGPHGKARIAGIDPARLRDELAKGRVVVVAGFQGETDGGEVATLGRGGSDTSAVALAAALRADRCVIYTDVRGVYTTDPRVVPSARQLPVIGYEEMLELAHHGAQVMQPRAVELSWVNNIVIEVASSLEEAPGTEIREEHTMEQRNKVRGIAIDRGIVKVTLVAVADRPGIAATVFGTLAEAAVNVDLIVQNTGRDGATDLSFAIGAADLPQARPVVEAIAASLGAAGVSFDESLAKVSIVGSGIANAPGYAARMFRVLADAGVNIAMIATSEIRITAVVPAASADEAARALHTAFELDAPAAA
jgi:aspartate kinase